MDELGVRKAIEKKEQSPVSVDTKHHLSRMEKASIVIWGAVIVLGLGVVFEGAYLASLAPQVTDANLKFGIYGLSIGIIGIGATFIPLGLSEIRGIRDAQNLNGKLNNIIERLKEIERRLPKSE